MRPKVQLEVPHTTQTHSWDCGISCAVSVLGFLDKSTDNVYGDDLEALGCGQSVWTVDLAHLMAMYGIQHHFCTSFLGVNKGYAKKSFYARNFSKDEERVNKLFQETGKHGISCEERQVSVDEILAHLDAGNILVCLVDWKNLECIWCDVKICKSLECFRSCCESYQGHFVVVCGFDTVNGHIYYKNPSYRQELCCSRIEKFERAWRSPGTDEDVLFVFKDKDIPSTAATNDHGRTSNSVCDTDHRIVNTDNDHTLKELDNASTVPCENLQTRTIAEDEHIRDESTHISEGSNS